MHSQMLASHKVCSARQCGDEQLHHLANKTRSKLSEIPAFFC